MDIKYLFKVLKINTHWLIIIPMIISISVFFMIRNQKDTFKSESLVYTGVATGYNINVESMDQTRTDYYATTVTYDNIINIINSREAKTEVGIRLLVDDILSDKLDISSTDYTDGQISQLLDKITTDDNHSFADIEIPPTNLQNNFAMYSDPFDDSNIAKVYKLLNAGDSTLINLLMNNPGSPYSIKNISSNLSVQRKGSSDMIEMKFISQDPDRAQKTLVTIIDVFAKKQTQLKETEALNVVKYFETELEEVSIKLKTSEEELKRFNEENGVVNFQTQTDNIAKQKETVQEEYDKELMTYRGANRARIHLENELKKKSGVPKFNTELVNLQDKLSNLNSQKVKLELQNKSTASITNQIKTVEQQIENAMNRQFQNKNTTGNVSSENLLTQWLQKTVEESESKARLEVYKQRLAQISREYDTYAPLGSKLSQLERQVNINEEEYLQLMNNLNQAKVRQNNISISSNVDIVDYPSKPTEPVPTKKLMYVVIAGIVGFIGVFSIIFIRVFFDNSIRTPQRAQTVLKLDAIGALPIFKKKKYKKYNEQLINQIISKLKLLLDNNDSLEIMIFSVYPKEGKTTFINEITTRLNDEDLKRLRFYEHPSLIDGNLHHELIKNKSDVQLIVIDANRELEEADFYHINRLGEVAPNRLVVINKIKRYILDSVLGRSPKN